MKPGAQIAKSGFIRAGGDEPRARGRSPRASRGVHNVPNPTRDKHQYQPEGAMVAEVRSSKAQRRRRSAPALRRPGLAPGALGCRRKFLRFFPGGFADPTCVEWERGYK